MLDMATWQEKVRALTQGRYGMKRKLCRAAGIPESSWDRIINHGGRPRREVEKVTKIAAALGVDPTWLLDDAMEGPPPAKGMRQMAQLTLDLLPQDQQRLVLALTDPRRRAALLAALDAYEAGSAPQRPPPRAPAPPRKRARPNHKP